MPIYAWSASEECSLGICIWSAIITLCSCHISWSATFDLTFALVHIYEGICRLTAPGRYISGKWWSLCLIGIVHKSILMGHGVLIMGPSRELFPGDEAHVQRCWVEKDLGSSMVYLLWHDIHGTLSSGTLITVDKVMWKVTTKVQKWGLYGQNVWLSPALDLRHFISLLMGLVYLL